MNWTKSFCHLSSIFTLLSFTQERDTCRRYKGNLSLREGVKVEKKFISFYLPIQEKKNIKTHFSSYCFQRKHNTKKINRRCEFDRTDKIRLHINFIKFSLYFQLLTLHTDLYIGCISYNLYRIMLHKNLSKWEDGHPYHFYQLIQQISKTQQIDLNC